MAEQIVSDGQLWLNEYNISSDLNTIVLNISSGIQENTTFGDAYIKRLAGLKTAAISMEGYFEGTPDGELSSSIATTNGVITVTGQDATQGDICYMMQPAVSEYSPGAAVGEMFSFSVNAEANGETIRGEISHNGTETTTGNGTGTQLGAISASQYLYATLHVTAASGTSPTLDVTIESDDNSGFTSATTRGTFTQATGVTSQWLTPVAGAITDDYWRAVYTIGGSGPSFTFVVSIGIGE